MNAGTDTVLLSGAESTSASALISILICIRISVLSFRSIPRLIIFRIPVWISCLIPNGTSRLAAVTASALIHRLTAVIISGLISVSSGRLVPIINSLLISVRT